MKRCPLCVVSLERVRYEGLPLFQCPQCCGHFVEEIRLKGIQKTKIKSKDDLKEAVRKHYQGNTRSELNCPRCMAFMDKEVIRRPMAIEYDRCKSCHAIWLDPGELAMMQLAWEATQRSRSVDAMKERHQQFMASPERQARFEENCALMNRGNESLSDAFGEGLWQGFLNAVFTAAGCAGRYGRRRSR